ncbi:hypothetical protein MRX96_058897 [Rhipicephalus microplus]
MIAHAFQKGSAAFVCAFRTAAAAVVERGEPTTLPPPSAASPRFSGDKPETGSRYFAEARSTLSTKVNRETTNDSVVRLHPLLIDTPARDSEDDKDYDEGQRLGGGDEEYRPSTKVSPGPTGVVRIHPLVIETPSKSDEDDDYDDGQRLGGGEKDYQALH